MSPGLDTSVVLRLLIGEPTEQAQAARRFLEDATATRGSAALVSDIVAGEAYFALRHHYSVPHGKAVRALRAFLDDSRIRATGVAPHVLRAAEQEGAPGVMDRLIHGDYERAGATLVTFDRGAARLSGARLIPG